METSLEQLKVALEAAKVGVWVWYVHENRIVWSEQLEILFGLKPKSFRGTYEEYISCIHPDDRERSQSVIQEAIKNKTSYQVEHRIVWPNGEVHWMHGSGKGFYDESGALKKMTGTSVDITERKIQEEHLKQKTQELNQFAAIVAHDLKSPLNSMTQFAELLAEENHGKLGGNSDLYIKFITEAGSRMSLFIDRLLQYARAGQVKVRDMEMVDLNSVLKNVEYNLTVQIEKSKNNIVVPKSLPKVYADEIQLSQVLQNLIVNAIKYKASHRDPKIEVHYEDRGNVWEMSFQDNGIGMNKSQLTGIFDFFNRAHSDVHAEGFGIGLAVCKKIIEAHEGKIWAESSQDDGSRFIFTLPKDC